MKNKKHNKVTTAAGLVLFFILFGSFITQHEMELVPGKKSNNSIIDIDEDELNDVINTLENEFGYTISEDKKDEYYMLNAIRTNPNLTTEQKELFYNYYDLIDDDPYLLREQAYKNLNEVQIVYMDRKEGDRETLLGEYNNSVNTIFIYTKNDTNNDVLLHEGIHCMFNSVLTSKVPSYMKEGMTELLCNEYFSTDLFYENSTYAFEINYVKMLCELVGSDIVLEAYSTGSIEKIVDKIDDFNNTEYTASKIMSIYEDAYGNLEKGFERQYSNEEGKKASRYLLQIYKNMGHDSLDNFIYVCDLASSVFEDDPTQFYSNYVQYNGVLDKAYFSVKLNNLYNGNNFSTYEDRPKILTYNNRFKNGH